MRNLSLALIAYIAGAVSVADAQEAKFPSRPITFVVPGGAGGGLDTTARQVAQAAERLFGMQIIIENRTGANGTIGVRKVVMSPPDGYTLAFVSNGMITMSPHSMDVPYTTDSYTPVVRIGVTAYTMCVRPEFPANNAQEFLAELAKNPNKYSYGLTGLGDTLHVSAEYVFSKFGAKARAVPFRGGGTETMVNFLGGHIDIFGGGIPSVLPQVAAGQAKCLLLTSKDDSPLLPSASGLAKLGIADFDGVLWFGVLAPKGTPEAIVDQLAKAFAQAADDKNVQAGLERIGAEAGVLGPKEFRELIDREYSSFGVASKILGIKQ